MKTHLTILFIFIYGFLSGQVTIDIHPNFKHTVGEMDTFNRKRMIKVHADQTEHDWTIGSNFENDADLLDTFLNGLDVYLGRNTGGISWYVNQVNEDPNRPGFANPVHLASLGTSVRNGYANRPGLHVYEDRNELVIASQQRPFFPDGTKTGKGWAFANGTATGEYMGRYINEFHGRNGRPMPTYIEIMNEPLYEFVTEGDRTPLEIFEFHNEVADAIRAQNIDIPIGGYTVAFPNFEEDNFQRWHDRWKLFVDVCGEKMDFWSIHLYDFNLSWSNTEELRRGSNLEATMDMIEHYSQVSFGHVKPFVISEYGGRALTLEANPWSPYRDWLSLKSMTSMLLSFSERPQHILSAIPFIVVKAEWGRQENGSPYPWRLMRQNKEMEGETGDYWVYTEQIKFYQLWSEVKGTRVDNKSTNPDIQSNAYVDGNKMYLIVNNLNFVDESIEPNIIEKYKNEIQSIKVKHLFLNTSVQAPVLDEKTYTSLDSIVLAAEGAMVIEYTFTEDIIIDEWVEETKYYSNEQLTPIITNAKHEFNINDVHKGEMGEAILRLGMGRAHGRSLTPKVTLNGKLIQVPSNYMGYDQAPKDSWFGVVDIPVPFAFIESNNVITVQYSDQGGHISSMSLRVFNHSAPVTRTAQVVPMELKLEPTFKQLELNQQFTLLAGVTPLNASLNELVWSSSDESIVSVDSFGNLTALRLGEAEITVSTSDSNLTAISTVEVVEQAAPVAITNFAVSPNTFSFSINDLLQMQAEIAPIDATKQTVSWISSHTDVAIVDEKGLVSGIQPGEVQIIGTTQDGNFSDTSHLTVVGPLETFINCNLLPDHLISDTEYEVQVEYSASSDLDIAVELKDANDRWVGEGRITVQTGTGIATITIKNVSTSDWMTPVSPEPGPGYIMRAWIRSVGGDWTTNEGGCNKMEINIAAATSTNTPEELLDSTIFPNPTQGRLYIELPELKGSVTAFLQDQLGRILHIQEINQKFSWVDLEHFHTGSYFITLRNIEGSVSQKIFLKK
ncbi:MAG: Ig-like domain-containing protein [Bacteroidota bacterium]